LRVKIKHVLFKLFFCFIWLFFIEGGETYDYYFFGEFDGVKIRHSKYLDLTIQTNEQKEAIKHMQISEYQRWEPYYKQKPKTNRLYHINLLTL
jgi:hypothetical protein